MTSGACSRCGAVGRLEGHHATGRVDGVPIHPGLIVIVRVECHQDEGAVWHGAGLEDRHPDVAVLLRRLAVWLSRWPRDLRVELVHELAGVLADLAERVEAGV